jgi:predicted nuclease of predicted toxin-antitoxin system
MDFLADMGISLRTVEWLREKGHNVAHLSEEGLQRLPDDEILEKAKLESRILLTVDLDFSQLLAISRSSLPSVVLFRLGNENYHHINDCLNLLIEDYIEDLRSGVMISVSTKSFRVRKLPIE